MTMTISKIVITGASGFVAKNIRQYFSQNNVKLVSISRNNFTKFKNETKILSKHYEKIDPNKIKQSSALIHLIGSQVCSCNYL